MNEIYLDELKDDVNSSGLSQQIIFKGFVDNVSDYMQLCDCVVLASDAETFGLVLIEAMQVGVAVIGTNSGGVPEIIEHEKSGLLFSPRDVDGLAAQIEKYRENPTLMAEMARQGKAVALKKFVHEDHYQQLEKIFTEMVN